jgi:hypothetical protein
MVEIRQAQSVAADARLSQLLERYDQLINDLSPRNATAVWESDSDERSGGARLRLSDAYGRSCRVLSEMDLQRRRPHAGKGLAAGRRSGLSGE